MTKTCCDICGNEMPSKKFADRIEDVNFCISSNGKIWDVCNECREDLNRWMTIRRQKCLNNAEYWKKCCPSKEIVKEWRKINPSGRKMQCHKDTNLSRPTIDRYWDLVLQEGE